MEEIQNEVRLEFGDTESVLDEFKRRIDQAVEKDRDKLKKLAQEHGCSLPQFSLAWILNNNTITSVLSGTTALEQLKENLAADDIKLSLEELKACDEVWQMFRPPRYHYAKNPQGLAEMKSAVGPKQANK